MRRLMAVSTIVAVSVLAGGTACAAGYVSGMNFFQFTNGDNGNGDGSGSAFQTGGWNATTDGAIWISTGRHARVEHAGPELPVGLPIHADVGVDHPDRRLPVEQRRGTGDVTRRQPAGYPVIGWASTARHGWGKQRPRQHVALPDRVQGPRHLLPARHPADGKPSVGQGDPAGDAVRLIRLDRRLQQLRCRRRRGRRGCHQRRISSRRHGL